MLIQSRFSMFFGKTFIESDEKSANIINKKLDAISSTKSDEEPIKHIQEESF
ncbi:hypothetical protein [uncultured Bacteroides sp.]|uniref:hypothetical protein n=1 Tax=uncultured Bacteroides sp. TaxID=162156 RepID=UPI002AA67FBD|nr:hypothetical protein [uncultured Bacteroides sp.]